MKKFDEEKVRFFSYLAVSICFYVGAAVEMIKIDGNNWVVNFCLGSAFLCLASTHLNKDKSKKQK